MPITVPTAVYLADVTSSSTRHLPYGAIWHGERARDRVAADRCQRENSSEKVIHFWRTLF